MKERDRYLKIVEWSEEDQCYVGAVPGWLGKCCHGSDEMKVYQDLCKIVDEWTGLFDSGEPVASSYSWDIEGTYEIRVKAKDIHGAESPWSDPLSVSMPKSKLLLRFPLFFRFLEEHPCLFPILRQLIGL